MTDILHEVLLEMKQTSSSPLPSTSIGFAFALVSPSGPFCISLSCSFSFCFSFSSVTAASAYGSQAWTSINMDILCINASMHMTLITALHYWAFKHMNMFVITMMTSTPACTNIMHCTALHNRPLIQRHYQWTVLKQYRYRHLAQGPLVYGVD